MRKIVYRQNEELTCTFDNEVYFRKKNPKKHVNADNENADLGEKLNYCNRL